MSMVNAFTQIPITRSAPSSSLSRTWKERLHSYSLEQPLDRVNVLGDDTHGHTGCVNALSWAKDGELLMSGGDDRTVRLWRIDPSDTTKDYPFVCEAVIFTGHTANIFNAQMLPNSNRIVTVAGDKQVRISDQPSGERPRVALPQCPSKAHCDRGEPGSVSHCL